MSYLYRGETNEAKRILEELIKNTLGTYVEHHNQPRTDDVSRMSKYLHYDHISSVHVALKIREADPPREGLDSYLEELIPHPLAIQVRCRAATLANSGSSCRAF